ncbi:MAG: type II toxin-antitoxin system RelE/ParE family toxin [Bdellovibrionales bacterium]
MIDSFANKIASELFHLGRSKRLPREHWGRAILLLDLMEAVDSLQDLMVEGFPPNLRLHKLKGIRKGEWAIDINKLSGWRIVFEYKNKMFINVKIENYH